MTAGEFDDDREDPCTARAHEDDSWHAFGPDYLDGLVLLGDAKVKPETLALLPLDGRWPEPRALWQDRVFVLRDRTPVDVAALDAAGAAGLLGLLERVGPALHQAAVLDERLTSSSALLGAMSALGVGTVDDADPGDWLDSTLLVRVLRARAGGRP